MVRQEKSRVETPTVQRALHELCIPSIPLKLISGSDTGRPDDLFLIPYGRPLLIEFKWGDLKPEPKQEYWHKIFKGLGYDVQVHNNVEQALTAIAVEVVAATLHEKGRKVSLRAWCCDPDVRSGVAQDIHYTRSLQFLEEARRRAPHVGDSAFKSVLSSVARRSS